MAHIKEGIGSFYMGITTVMNGRPACFFACRLRALTTSRLDGDLLQASVAHPILNHDVRINTIGSNARKKANSFSRMDVAQGLDEYKLSQLIDVNIRV